MIKSLQNECLLWSNEGILPKVKKRRNRRHFGFHLNMVNSISSQYLLRTQQRRTVTKGERKKQKEQGVRWKKERRIKQTM